MYNKLSDKFNADGYRITDTHVFFYKKWLSNFHRSPFKFSYDGEEHEFWCNEQAFMWVKAKMFKDDETAIKILNETDSPMKCKNLGREVKNYDDAKWNEVRYQLFEDINFEKYRQNKELCKLLFQPDFYGKTFVEASPTDCIWGVGMDIHDDRIVDPKNWRGQNLLGKAITAARERISLQGMLTVGDLIEYLKKYDPNAYILYGEVNAFEGGFWQHTCANQVGMFVRSVAEEKEWLKERFGTDTGAEKSYERDFIYAKDNDVIVRF